MYIRNATVQDVKRISYLIQHNTENVVENKYTSEQIRTWKRANTPTAIFKSLASRTILCAFLKNRLVGTIGLQGKEVVGLYVNFSKRRCGIGKELLNHLELYGSAPHNSDNNYEG